MRARSWASGRAAVACALARPGAAAQVGNCVIAEMLFSAKYTAQMMGVMEGGVKTTPRFCDQAKSGTALVAAGQLLRDQERQFQRLFGVQARVAEGFVTITKVCFGQALRAAYAFRYVLAGHF